MEGGSGNPRVGGFWAAPREAIALAELPPNISLLSLLELEETKPPVCPFPGWAEEGGRWSWVAPGFTHARSADDGGGLPRVSPAWMSCTSAAAPPRWIQTCLRAFPPSPEQVTGRVEGACGQDGAQVWGGQGRRLGVAGVTGHPHTPWDYSRGCQAGRGTSQTQQGGPSAGSLQDATLGLAMDKVPWDRGDNPTGRPGKYTSPHPPHTQRLLGQTRGSQVEFITAVAVPQMLSPNRAPAGAAGRLRRCCPRVAAGDTARRAGDRRGSPGSPSTSGLVSVRCGEQGGRGGGIRLVCAVINVPPPRPSCDEKPNRRRVGDLPEGCSEQDRQGEFDPPGSPGGGHGLILLPHRSPHPPLPPPLGV